MSEQYDVDLAVIGAGPGGYVSAIRASQLGLTCCVIEKDKAGGVCGNWGCIPSKSLLNSAEIFRQTQVLEAMGIKVDTSGFDYAKVQKKSRDASARSERGVLGLLKKNKVEFIQGTATIPAAHEVLVTQAGQTRIIKAKNILLATGSRPRSLPGLDFDEERILSSTGILSLTTLPASLVILGAGAIGLEFAYVMSSFGVAVTVVEMLDRILPHEDEDVSKVLKNELGKKGISIFTGTKVNGVRKGSDQVELDVSDTLGESKLLTAEKLLVAVGRTPNSQNLGLESLGITLEEGFVPTADYYQTSVQGLYAIGDLIKSPLLAHVASKEGEIAVEHMAGKAHMKRLDSMLVPSAVYTEPSVGSFGLTEAQAKAQGVDCAVFSFPYLGIGKAGAVEKTQGFVKVVCHGSTKEILGAHIVGHNASEIIHEVLLAKKADLLPEDIATMVHAHPSISEGIMEAMRGIEGWVIHM